jgi:hypothetical protein
LLSSGLWCWLWQESAPGGNIDDLWHNTVETATAEEARSTSNFWDSDFWGLDTDPYRSDASNQASLYEEQQQYYYLHQQQGEDQEEEAAEEEKAQTVGYDDYRGNINAVSSTTAMNAVESPPRDSAPRNKEDKVESEASAKPSQPEAPAGTPAGSAAPAGSPAPDDVASRSAPTPSPPAAAAAAAADMAASAQDEEILAPDVAARGTDLNLLKIQTSNSTPTDAKVPSRCLGFRT